MLEAATNGADAGSTSRSYRGRQVLNSEYGLFDLPKLISDKAISPITVPATS